MVSIISPSVRKSPPATTYTLLRKKTESQFTVEYSGSPVSKGWWWPWTQNQLQSNDFYSLTNICKTKAIFPKTQLKNITSIWDIGNHKYYAAYFSLTSVIYRRFLEIFGSIIQVTSQGETLEMNGAHWEDQTEQTYNAEIGGEGINRAHRRAVGRKWWMCFVNALYSERYITARKMKLKMTNATEIVDMRGHADRQRQLRGRMERQDELHVSPKTKGLVLMTATSSDHAV